MAVRTRFGIGSLVKERAGSVEFPEEVTCQCPNCGTLVADKGNCLVSIVPLVTEVNGKKKMILNLVADCRVCGYDGKGPAVEW